MTLFLCAVCNVLLHTKGKIKLLGVRLDVKTCEVETINFNVKARLKEKSVKANLS